MQKADILKIFYFDEKQRIFFGIKMPSLQIKTHNVVIRTVDSDEHGLRAALPRPHCHPLRPRHRGTECRELDAGSYLCK